MKLLAIVLLAPSLALAQPKVIYTWKEEPLTVLGQKLGAPISLPSCSKDLGYGETCSTLVTRVQDRAIYQVKNPARLGLPYNATVYTRRDRVSHVVLSAGAEHQVALYRLLVQRYGFPHQQQTFNKGTTPAFKSLVWVGKESKMRFVESLDYALTPQSSMVWAASREDFDVKLSQDNPKRPAKPSPVEAPRVITGPGF